MFNNLSKWNTGNLGRFRSRKFPPLSCYTPESLSYIYIDSVIEWYHLSYISHSFAHPIPAVNIIPASFVMRWLRTNLIFHPCVTIAISRIFGKRYRSCWYRSSWYAISQLGSLIHFFFSLYVFFLFLQGLQIKIFVNIFFWGKRTNPNVHYSRLK